MRSGSRRVGSGLRQASQLADFLRSPRGAFVVGEHFAFWNAGSVCAWRVWGAAGPEDGRQLVRCIETAYDGAVPRYWSVVDLRSLTSVDEAGFSVLRDYVDRLRPRMAQRLVRQAILKPRGLVGAMVSGFYVQLRPRHPVRVFEQVAAAARWLRPEDPAALRSILQALQRPLESGGVAGALRSWLADHLTDSAPRAAARTLGLSTRTLQRRLREQGTGFQELLRQARLERARALLRETDWKLVAVAAEAGFSSSQQLATCFREVEGLSPSMFRQRYRATIG